MNNPTAIEKVAIDAEVSLSGVGEELLRRFYLGRPALTVDAYTRDVAAFAGFVSAPSPEAAVVALLGGGKQAADAITQEWAATMVGAPTTRARRLGTIRGLTKFAREIGLIDWDLKVKSPRVEPYRDTAGPGAEAIRAMLTAASLLEGLAGLRARLVLLLLCMLGLRRQEVASLLVGSYDPQTRRMHILGKGGRTKLLTVPKETEAALREWIASLQHKEPKDPLIQRLDAPGKAVTGQAIYKIVALLGKHAGVRTWPHGIRHTSVTEVTRMHGLLAASEFARHKDVKTTMVYQDNLENLAGKGAESLEEFFLKSPFVQKFVQTEEGASLFARMLEHAHSAEFCWYCGIRYDKAELVIEHKTPRARGGTDDSENLTIACVPCNVRKGTKTVEEFRRFCAVALGVDPLVFAGEAREKGMVES